jgi:exodeoxyribonuclease VII large subunit
LRAPTPSAAAELVIRSRQEVEDHAESLRQRLLRAMRYRLLSDRQALTDLAHHGAFLRMRDAINQHQQKLDDLKYRMERGERQILERHRRRWELAAAAVRHYDVRRMLSGIRKELRGGVGALTTGIRAVLIEKQSRLDQVSGRLEALSPLAILERGYALVFDSSGRLLKAAGQVEVGDEISARLAQGTVTASVKKRSAE